MRFQIISKTSMIFSSCKPILHSKLYFSANILHNSTISFTKNNMYHTVIVLFLNLIKRMHDHSYNKWITFFTTLFVMQACDFKYDQKFSQLNNFFVIEIFMLVHIFFRDVNSISNIANVI